MRPQFLGFTVYKTVQGPHFSWHTRTPATHEHGANSRQRLADHKGPISAHSLISLGHHLFYYGLHLIKSASNCQGLICGTVIKRILEFYRQSFGFIDFRLWDVSTFVLMSGVRCCKQIHQRKPEFLREKLNSSLIVQTFFERVALKYFKLATFYLSISYLNNVLDRC